MKLDVQEYYYLNVALCEVLDAGSRERIIDLAKTKLKDYWEVTIEELNVLAFKSFTDRRTFFNLPAHISILQHFWYAGFADFLKNDFVPTFEKLKVPANLIKDIEHQASKNLFKTTFMENLLIFVRNYFNLPSFNLASHVQLAEVILALKDKTNNDIFQRTLNELQMKQIKAKMHKGKK